jgi:membrane fusion protein, copper/silver efflux system
MPTPVKLLLVLGLAAGAYLAGRMGHGTSSAPSSPHAGRQILHWACPMHPQYKSDRPGDAPCCGMRLEPVYSDSPASQAGPARPEGSIEATAVQQQLIGVRTDEVKRAPASYLLRVPGRVTVDDARQYRLVAPVDGWIRKLGQNPAGAFVKKNEIVATYYTPTFVSAQQSLLYTLRGDNPMSPEAAGGAPISPMNLNLINVLDALRSLGMHELQLEELKRTRTFASEINIYSPASGYVMSRSISPGQRFEKGSELYRVADITRVWVMTDIFEKDRDLVKPGATAAIRYQGRRFQARMSEALPQFDPQSRTLRTRFELANPGNSLRPDVFVDVEIELRLPPAIAVPSDAVIDSGRRKTVFVAKGDDAFEARSVETGWRFGDRVEITKGLETGERVVVSGNFLIDSESRMRMPANGGEPSRESSPLREKATVARDPVCGMSVDAKAPNVIKAQKEGVAVYFCSEHCRKSFETAPAKNGNSKHTALGEGGRRGPA